MLLLLKVATGRSTVDVQVNKTSRGLHNDCRRIWHIHINRLGNTAYITVALVLLTLQTTIKINARSNDQCKVISKCILTERVEFVFIISNIAVFLIFAVFNHFVHIFTIYQPIRCQLSPAKSRLNHICVKTVVRLSILQIRFWTWFVFQRDTDTNIFAVIRWLGCCIWYWIVGQQLLAQPSYRYTNYYYYLL